MPRREVRFGSVYNTEKRRQALALGGLANDKMPWTTEATDELLEGFFIHEYRYVSDGKCFAKVCRRSMHAISDHLWKLFSRYIARENVVNYKPKKRTNRTGDVATLRDYACIEKAVRVRGTAYVAYDPAYLGRIMGRSSSDVLRIYGDMLRAYRDKQLIPDMAPPITFSGTESQLKVIREAVKGSYSKLMSEIGG